MRGVQVLLYSQVNCCLNLLRQFLLINEQVVHSRKWFTSQRRRFHGWKGMTLHDAGGDGDGAGLLLASGVYAIVTNNHDVVVVAEGNK